MAKMNISQKQQRMLTFLVGSLHPQVLAKLGERGFDLAVHERGWNLLGMTVRLRAGASPRPARVDPSLDALESLERTWVPVAEATLQANFPTVFERVFAGYARESGPRLLLTLSLLRDRVAAVVAAPRPEDRSAWELLQRRGVTADVLAAFDANLARAVRAPAETADAGDSEERGRAELARAEVEMWSFYLEWSRIARATLTDRRDLRRLGFLRGRPDGSPALGSVDQ